MDSIIVQMDQNNEPFYMHVLKKGETVYSLSRLFKANYNDILILNNLSDNVPIPLKTLIKIPINKDYLLTGPTKKCTSCIPVYYFARRKETLFRIAQVYFAQSIQALVYRNKIEKLSVRIAQELHVGWWPTPESEDFTNEVHESADPESKTTIDHNNPPDAVQIHENIQVSETILDRNEIATDSINLDTTSIIQPTIISNKGIAIWERSDNDTSSLLVLHRTAQLGSVIKLQNPVTDLIVVAEVIGHIPENVYTDDIDIIISKAVANKLGALDTRFQVLMTYYE